MRTVRLAASTRPQRLAVEIHTALARDPRAAEGFNEATAISCGDPNDKFA